MDARDITEKVPEVKDGRYLEKIYELQKELIDHYVKIEGLPPYPIDVNTKKSQVIIKDFVGRVIEELAEGYESMLLIDELCTKSLYWSYNYDDEDLNQCINHLQNVSEEMADAMHFMVELLIYVNIQPEDIYAYIKKEIGKENYESLDTDITGNVLKFAMGYGSTQLQDDITPVSCLDLLKLDTSHAISEEDENLYRAARDYNHVRYMEMKSCLWEVAYHLNIARNFLKNKPWKQSQMMTDEIRFQAEIVKGFIKMMGVFAILGLNPETLFYIYFKKNRANAFRIKSNY